MCEQCDYAANEQMAESKYKEFNNKDEQQLAKEDVLGEGIIGVEPLADFLKIPVEKTSKTILFNADGKIIAAVIRGDFDVNETKLARILKADTIKLATQKEVKETTGSEVGYAGPLNLNKDIKVIWDKSTKDRVNFEAGANKTNYHSININFGKDLDEPSEYLDIRQAKVDEACPKCDTGKLIEKSAIEFGHVFKQDQFYTKSLNATFTDENNKQQLLWMGAYGIGIGRAMATIVETHNDEKGIIWPDSVSPFAVHLIELPGASNAEDIYNNLLKQNIDVLWDERNISAGEKFADSDLIGIPHRIVVSSKTADKLEYKHRTSKESKLVDFEEFLNIIN
jgi:prolyl-tRNA synthetase